VLVTRPEPGAHRTAARLVELGFRPVLAPMLAVRMQAADLPAPAEVQAVLVTSANAVAGLPAAFGRVRLLAVGAATAARARAAGFGDVRSADGDAGDLAALARACCTPAGGRLLLAHGAGQGDGLTAALTADGFAVARAAVYAARAVERMPAAAAAAWRAGGVAAALFYSAETARAFVTVATAEGMQAGAVGAMAVAIGAAAAAALAPLPWRAVRVADRPDQEAMLALLR
jgi:uroporphyrinogen-III synthase